MLTSSLFYLGLRCPKALNLAVREGFPPTPNNRSRLKNRLRQLGFSLFPGGAFAPRLAGKTESAEKTRELIKQHPMVFQGTFIHDETAVTVDILRKEGGEWEMIEISPATSAQKAFAPDTVLKYSVLTKLGYAPLKVTLLYLDKEYIREGALDLSELFLADEITAQVKKRHGGMVRTIKRLKNAMVVRQEVKVGTFCLRPTPCPFYHRCWDALPEHSVFALSKLHLAEKFDLFHQGITTFDQIPEAYNLSAGQKLQIRTHREGEPHINRQAVREFLGHLRQELWFLDFESFQPAVPLFEGTHPYETIPFQFSLHRYRTDTGELEHFEFIAETGEDPRPLIAERLHALIPANAQLVAYNKQFERMILERLAQSVPEHADALRQMAENLVDLMEPFQKRHYYTKEMKGKHSIKAVLPALVPELDYENMEVGNGEMAIDAYEMMFDAEPEEKQRLKNALLEYCQLDTLAMVRIYEKLREEAA